MESKGTRMVHSKPVRVGSLGCLGCLVVFMGACGQNADPDPDKTASVVRQYALLLDANYNETIASLEALKSSVDGFVAAPSADGLVAARQAWLTARTPYGASEVSRFYGGPMDEVQGAMDE